MSFWHRNSISIFIICLLAFSWRANAVPPAAAQAHIPAAAQAHVPTAVPAGGGASAAHAAPGSAASTGAPAVHSHVPNAAKSYLPTTVPPANAPSSSTVFSPGGNNNNAASPAGIPVTPGNSQSILDGKGPDFTTPVTAHQPPGLENKPGETPPGISLNPVIDIIDPAKNPVLTPEEPTPSISSPTIVEETLPTIGDETAPPTLANTPTSSTADATTPISTVSTEPTPLPMVGASETPTVNTVTTTDLNSAVNNTLLTNISAPENFLDGELSSVDLSFADADTPIPERGSVRSSEGCQVQNKNIYEKISQRFKQKAREESLKCDVLNNSESPNEESTAEIT